MGVRAEFEKGDAHFGRSGGPQLIIGAIDAASVHMATFLFVPPMREDVLEHALDEVPGIGFVIKNHRGIRRITPRAGRCRSARVPQRNSADAADALVARPNSAAGMQGMEGLPMEVQEPRPVWQFLAPNVVFTTAYHPMYPLIQVGEIDVRARLLTIGDMPHGEPRDTALASLKQLVAATMLSEHLPGRCIPVIYRNRTVY